MAPKLNIGTLISGLILSIAVAVLLTITIVIPAWNQHKKPSSSPGPRGLPCTRVEDCEQDELCAGGYCTKKYVAPKFPWALVIGITAMVITGLVAFSMQGINKVDDSSRPAATKQMLFSGGIVVAVLIAIVATTYIAFSNATKGVCPDKPSYDCPPGQENLCTRETGYQWACVENTSGGACPPEDKPICGVGEASCDPSTGAWECPDKKCSGSAPPELKCDSGSSAACGPETGGPGGFQWICRKQCDDSKRPSSCPAGKIAACEAPDFTYKCIDKPDEPCAGQTKLTCPGVYCDAVLGKGFTWICPGTLDRNGVIQKYGLKVVMYKNADLPKSKVAIAENDGTPVYPTVGKDCRETDTSPTYYLPPPYLNALNNPAGNLGLDSNSEVVFYPYDPTKRIYAQIENPSTDPSDDTRGHPCIIYPGKGLAGPCLNKGTWRQTKHNVSDEGAGVCICPKQTAGANCQYTDAATCSGHGAAQSDGSCKCEDGHPGANCENSRETTCNGHGDPGFMGYPAWCNCDDGYVSFRTYDKKPAGISGDMVTGYDWIQCKAKSDENCLYWQGALQDQFIGGVPQSKLEPAIITGCTQFECGDPKLADPGAQAWEFIMPPFGVQGNDDAAKAKCDAQTKQFLVDFHEE
jgi:hypothetical protein